MSQCLGDAREWRRCRGRAGLGRPSAPHGLGPRLQQEDCAVACGTGTDRPLDVLRRSERPLDSLAERGHLNHLLVAEARKPLLRLWYRKTPNLTELFVEAV